MVSIIDYGVGNLGSLVNIHKRLGLSVDVADTPDLVERSTHLILPGVGSFDAAIIKLRESGLLDSLEKSVIDFGKPILGICLGMQMMTDGSEEGELDGLGWVSGRARRFDFASGLKIPHVGWNTVESVRKNCLFSGNSFLRYYFVHSFHVVCDDVGHIIGRTDYGIEFTSAFCKDNIYGVQFHPEKSHNFGKTLLNKFSQV